MFLFNKIKYKIYNLKYKIHFMLKIFYYNKNKNYKFKNLWLNKELS